MKKILFITGLFLGTILTFAQAPEKMSYQAIIRNASGQLLQNQSVAVKASILQGSSSGTVVYSERLTGTTNANGLLSVEIGGGTILSGTFNTINWSSGNYWLKTETDPSGGTNYSIVGTSQLLSVPYAMYAKSSGSGSSFTLPYNATNSSAGTTFGITNNNGSNGDVAITGYGVGAGMGVQGITSGGKGVYGSGGSGTGVEGFSNSGTAGYFSSTSGLALKTGTGGTEINGALKITSGTPGNNKVLTSDASGNATWKNPQAAGWELNGNDSYYSLGGNVGIGTNTPSEKLEVLGKTKTVTLQVISGAGAGKVLTSDASGNATWQTAGAGSSQWTTNGNNIYNANTGNVGIGTDPGSSTKLNVKGSDTYSLFVENTAATNTALRAQAVNDRAIWAVSGGNTTSTLHAQNSGGGPTITTNGKVGINNVNPSYMLDVNGRMRLRNEAAGVPVGLWLDGPTSAARSFFGTFNQNLMGIYGISSGWSFLHDITTGNTGIGIGENTPNSKLQVGGSVSMPFIEVTDNYTVTDNDYTIRFVTAQNTNVSKTITLPPATGRAGRIYKIYASIRLSGPAEYGSYTPTTLKVIEAGTNINVIAQENSFIFAVYEKAMQNTIAAYGSSYNDQLKLTSITVQSDGTSWKIIDDNFSFTKNTF